MLLQQRELSAQDFLALTKKVFEGVEPDIVDNLTRSNRDQILRYLEKRGVESSQVPIVSTATGP